MRSESCCTSLSKTLWEMEKIFITSNFSFSHSVFHPYRAFCLSIKFGIVDCKLFQFGRVLTGQKHETFTLCVCSQRFFGEVVLAYLSKKGEVECVSATTLPESPRYLNLGNIISDGNNPNDIRGIFIHTAISKQCSLHHLASLGYSLFYD